MDVLTAAACALFVNTACPVAHPAPTVAAPTTTQRIAQWNGYIGEAAQRFSIPQDWIRNVMAQESVGLTLWNGRPITSPKGAMGLMQLMPDTWSDMRARLHLGNDPYDPHDNILAGAAYLKDMMDRFGAGGFAAYNAGPARYAAYLEGRLSLPDETKGYVARLHGDGRLPASSPLFVVRNDQAVAASGGLFVPLSTASQ